MESILTSLTSPIWSNAEHTAIDCFITTSQFGDEVLPFTASQDDVAEHGRAIFADIVDGKYGVIGAYVAPPALTTDELSAAARIQRNALLTATDWTQAADVPQATKDLWTTYRQALRDVPEQSGFPTNIVWPVKP
jgi:hypothetical protein